MIEFTQIHTRNICFKNLLKNSKNVLKFCYKRKYASKRGLSAQQLILNECDSRLSHCRYLLSNKVNSVSIEILGHIQMKVHKVLLLNSDKFVIGKSRSNCPIEKYNEKIFFRHSNCSSGTLQILYKCSVGNY